MSQSQEDQRDYQMADLSHLSNKESPPLAEEGRCKSQKKPRRVLHFSDGVMEEYSTDEEEEEEKEKEEEQRKQKSNPMTLVDPKTLKWGPWFFHWLQYGGNSALAACDYVGETLANALGITSPKYQYEIDEYKAILEEEKAEEEEEAAQMAGWTTTAPASPSEGIKHKIMDSSVMQESSQPSSLDQVKCESEVAAPTEAEQHSENQDQQSEQWKRY